MASASVRSARSVAPRIGPAFLYSGAPPWSRFVTAAKINIAALALTALIAGGLGGCGRAGPLEPPPDATAVAKPANDANADATVPRAHPKPKPIQPPKQPFILDPLL